MKRTKAQRVLAAVCGPALGVLLAVPVAGLLAGAAGRGLDLLHGMHHADHRHRPHAGGAGRRSGDDHGGRNDFDCTVHVQRAGVHRC